MSDILTKLEDMMEERYNARRDILTTLEIVTDWADANYRAGYLKAIRDVGQMIREIRNPQLAQETGEVPDIISAANEENV